MSQHTPGPWKVKDVFVQGHDGSFVADCGYPLAAKANARLIAKAPELLEALKDSVANHCRHDRMFCSTCTPARKLIAEIEGPAESGTDGKG